MPRYRVVIEKNYVIDAENEDSARVRAAMLAASDVNSYIIQQE